MTDLETLRRYCQMNTTPKRYRHSVAVQRQSMKLAYLYGADAYQAAVSGLLHDVTRCWRDEWQLKYMGASGIMLTKAEEAHPVLWHAKTAAHLAWNELGIHDAGIYRAILYHTTGRAAMSPLELAVCLGDATSSDREYPDVEVLREMACRSSGEAMAYFLEYTMDKLTKQGSPVSEIFKEAYDYYV